MWKPGIRRALLACGLAVAVTLLLDGLWLVLPDGWGERIPFSLFLFVVSGVALLGGFWPGMLAVVLGVISGFFIGHPHSVWSQRPRGDWVLLGIFLAFGPLAAFVCASLRRALEERRLALLEAERRAQEEAQRLNAKLAESLESERAARTASEHANRLKDDFVAAVSHELRTPLNAILGWADLLRRASVGPDKLARGLEVIARNARAQGQIVDDLLDLSRITAGKVHLELAHEDLSGIVEAAVDGQRNAALAKRLEIHTELAPTAALVDAARIQQVVWNLLSNAIKFTPEGGRIEVSVAPRDEGWGVLRVRDTGEGIDAEFLPHMFERFRQADPSLARLHGGLGLGLAISRHLVELHGGNIRAHSEGRGRGAEITVTLPSPPAGRNGALRDNGAGPAPSLMGMTVLVVDDEPDAREVAQRILEEHGASVMVAASAAEAQETLRAGTPSVIVSDIGMPGIDGYELLRRLRSAGDTRVSAVPAVALTAYARPEERERALAAGYQEHVAKPVGAATLIAAIKKAYGNASQRSA